MRLRKVVLPLACMAALVAGCGSTSTASSSSTQQTSTSAPVPTPVDQSSFIVQDITSSWAGIWAKNNPGSTSDITGVSCVENGSTQSYQCLGTATASLDPGVTFSVQIGATCDNAGDCIWHVTSSN